MRTALENELAQQRTQWDHERQGLISTASRIRHARVTTQRVLSDTRSLTSSLSLSLSVCLFFFPCMHARLEQLYCMAPQVNRAWLALA